MKPDIRPAVADEPAVHSPQLRALTELARAAAPPPLRVDAERLYAGYLAARRRRLLRGLGGLALAAAALALLVPRLDLGLSQSPGPQGHVAQDMSASPGERQATPRGPVPARVVADSDVAPSPTVPGPDADLDPADADPRALVRRADSLRAAGQPAAAAALLRRVVQQHPDDPLARGALLDLAHLLKQLARPDEARCAYRLYLDRHPDAPHLAGDVEKALARLGPGPACDGLTPR